MLPFKFILQTQCKSQEVAYNRNELVQIKLQTLKTELTERTELTAANGAHCQYKLPLQTESLERLLPLTRLNPVEVGANHKPSLHHVFHSLQPFCNRGNLDALKPLLVRLLRLLKLVIPSRSKVPLAGLTPLELCRALEPVDPEKSEKALAPTQAL